MYMSYFSLDLCPTGLDRVPGIVAEKKKPAAGVPLAGVGETICKFPSDPTVVLGSLSVVAPFICTGLGFVSVFYPYKNECCVINSFFVWSIDVWATISESLHHMNNVHQSKDYACPTAKTGLFGGAAFLCLNAMVFWLIFQMLTHNAREDYLKIRVIMDRFLLPPITKPS
ncbi:uncharacterized protein LOC113334613 [Papaver somniferum]|uniref:uncharacterized protein LOC113334613 n=1 Tax=Papaver somniferum TaxID=3469 RepID=UPI000E703F95|nr:uncharacterized protein LOC113334613 [Papaver somniferum]